MELSTDQISQLLGDRVQPTDEATHARTAQLARRKRNMIAIRTTRVEARGRLAQTALFNTEGARLLAVDMPLADDLIFGLSDSRGLKAAPPS
jgi:hypothetical protein